MWRLIFVLSLLFWTHTITRTDTRTDALGFTLLHGTLSLPNLAALGGLSLNTCPVPELLLERLLYERTQGQGADLSCGNQVLSLIHFPNADPAYSPQPPSPLGGFDVLARQLREAKHEILIANMLWDAGAGSPGQAMAQTLAQMRLDVRDHPERFPQGLTVRILLGHSIRRDDLLDPQTNAFNAAQDLLAAGIPLRGDPVQGWHLELADYALAIPHQHVKLIVLDGQDVTTGGFNISWYHVPATTRQSSAFQGGGQDLNDLALRVRGPIARNAVATFRDGWLLSRRLVCQREPTPNSLRRDCTFSGETTYTLTWTAPAKQLGQANVYALYRRNGYATQDDTVAALFGAAQQSIDVIRSQVSGTLGCSLSLTLPGACQFPRDHLAVWQAAVRAVKGRGVKLRLLLDYDPMLRLEGLALLGSLRAELKKSGLQDHLEARWYGTPGGTHTKAALIDGQMLTVGSQNLHFSAFGPHGLSEYTLATSDPAAIQAFQKQFEFEWGRGDPVMLPLRLR